LRDDIADEVAVDIVDTVERESVLDAERESGVICTPPL
jgi:hypothetical protein